MTDPAMLIAQKRVQAPPGLHDSPLTLLRRYFTRRWEIRRGKHALSEMPDHILKDIGLTRSQITSAVMHGRRHGR